MSGVDYFDRYESAVTQADLYSRQGGVNEDFGKFMEEPETDSDSVDVSGIPNSTPGKEEFLRTVFSRRFHVVYGAFGSNPFGPGNNIMFKFDQSGNRLRMIRITQQEAEHPLGPEMGVFNEIVDPMTNLSVRGVAFKGGDDLDISFIETPSTYKRASGGDPDAEPARVYNLQARKAGDSKIVYNYFVVPIAFA